MILIIFNGVLDGALFYLNERGDGMRSPMDKPNRITSRFGPRTLDGKFAMHNGIDLAPADRTHPCAIYAVCGGTVVDVISHLPETHTGLKVTTNQRGNLVCWETPERFRVWMMHLKAGSVTLKKGDTVSEGDVIGVMGTTGRSTGIHLHYELRDPRGQAFDPEPYLDNDLMITGKRRMRLVKMEKAPVIIDGRTVQIDQRNNDGVIEIPLREIAALFGFDATWDEARKMAVITTKAKTARGGAPNGVSATIA